MKTLVLTPDPDNIICHECGLSCSIPPLADSHKAQCPRCGFVLSAKHTNALDRILAFSFTALIFLAASLPFEFLSFKSNGLERTIDVAASFNILIDNQYHTLALMELVTIFVIPLIILLGLIYLLFPLKQGRCPPHGKRVLDMVFWLIPWSMAEIFLIGALVSLIKIISLADIVLGPSFFAYILFSVALTTVMLHLDKHQLYKLLNKANKEPVEDKHHSSSHGNDRSISIQKTWALIITSIVLYIPANMLPIMNTRLLGQDDPSTILGGVILLWHMGSYPIAAVIFIASVAVPVAKILVLIWLNYSVQRRQTNLTQERIVLYRIAEFVGRWSMVDVYVVIILVSLIQLGNTMSIYPGGASLAFCGVVIVTMLAAMTFDSHLIFNTDKNHEH
ncbi:MAG: paraquat-inducible protein A [Algicola sp.]|nr:paraquat-inducible protein A [Algicola sp.]